MFLIVILLNQINHIISQPDDLGLKWGGGIIVGSTQILVLSTCVHDTT